MPHYTPMCTYKHKLTPKSGKAEQSKAGFILEEEKLYAYHKIIFLKHNMEIISRHYSTNLSTK